MKGPTLALCAALLLLYTPVNADKCRTGCHGVTPNIFKYAEGTTYKYNLDGNIDISLSSAEGQQTSTKIKGKVLLTQQSNCNQAIKIQSLEVFGPDGKKYSGIPNIGKAIGINFHDGHVEDEICTEVGDTQHSLNIKRAVASMFQAALKHHHESDVFGDCPTDITSRKEGQMFIIHKTRHLNRCAHRESIKQDFMATSFNDNSEIHASPLLNAEYESEQKLKNGILDHAMVMENYVYKPFSNGKNGAKATVTTKLTFAGTSKDAIKEKPSTPKSIHFENPHMEISKVSNIDNILAAMKDAKLSMDISVTETSAKYFAQLIKVLRASKKEDILAVYGQIKAGAGAFKDRISARKVYFDALFRTGTGEAVESMLELLKNKELSQAEQKLVYLGLSFIRHATPASLKAATALAGLKDVPREAYLGMGTLAGHYCNEHSCENLEELNKLMEKMSSKLTTTPANHDEENKVIAILKGLANIHHLSDSILDKLTGMASDKKAPTRLRVAALETFLADACKSKLRDAAMKILKDREEDSEVRIKAYLAIAQCPDSKSAHSIQELLDTEPVYQVGGFIVSHLRNLRASANPDKEAAKQHLSMVKTAKKFPIDPRKYSFNNEFSYTVDSAGIGNSIESNVIYSQDSFLPRSTNLNLTAEFFGHSFNFMEIGTRQENLDKVLEHYFGPLGVFSSHTPEELYNTGKASAGKIVEHIRKRFQKIRGKRDISKADIETFAKQIQVHGHHLNNNLDLDLSVKILGSEMLFLSMNQDIEKLTPDAIIDKIFDEIDGGLEKAKNFEYHMKNHLLFLDVEMSYPTSMGLPLRLNVEGTSAMHFIASGSLDIVQILKDPKNAHMKASIIPSANIELAGMMEMDAHFFSTGLKVSSSILTSTGTDLTVKLLNGDKGIDIVMGLPIEKQKLVSFAHNIVFSTQELGKQEVQVPLKFKDKTKEFSVCFDQLVTLTGLTFCGELNTPSNLATNNVAFPLNGPVKMSIVIEREDVKEYHFKALLNDQTPTHPSIQITFDTPGSETKRHVDLLLEAMSQPNKMLKATLKSPIKEAVAEALITDTDTEKSAMVRFQHDQIEYYGKIGVSVKGNGAKQIYQPLIEYHTPNDIVKTKGNRKPDYHVEGQVIMEKSGDKQKFTFDNVKLISPSAPAIVINGNVARDGKKYSTDMKVTRDQINVNFKGNVQASPEKIKLEAEMENNIDAIVNFHVKYDMHRGPGLLENNLVLVHGANLKSKKHVLTISQLLKNKYENANEFNFETKNKVTYPLVNLELKLEGKATRKHFEYDVHFNYDKFKLESELDAKISHKHTGDYDVKFELEAMSNKLDIKAKRDISGDKSTVANMLQLNGKKYQIDGTITHHLKANDINMGTDLVIKIHEKPDPIKVNTKVISNAKELDSMVKMTMGKEVLVDMMVKGTKGPNPNGNMKVMVPNVISANGNFKSTDGVGSGMLLVDIPKMERKIKAEAAVTCKDPTHNVKLDVFFDFEKDNTKKLHLETNNQITKSSIDSKNKIDFLGNTMEANVKGHMDGKIMDGKMSGEFDVLLPNQHYVTGKLNREVHVVDNVANGNAHVTITHQMTKTDPACKLDIKVLAKDTDMKKRIFDITYNVLVESSNGRNIMADVILKHLRNGENHDSAFKTHLHGSLMPQPLEVEVTGLYTAKVGTYKAHGKYGANMGVNVNGKYNAAGGASPLTGDIDIEITTPQDNYKNLKGHASGSLLMPQEDGHFEISGTSSATLNNEKTVKLEGAMKSHKHEGDMKVTLTVPEVDTMSLAGYYKHEDTSPGFGKCKCGVEVHYGKSKQVKADMTLVRPNSEEMDFEIDLHTPAETAKHINLHLKGKRSNGGKHFNSEIVLTADDKKYSMSKELVISEVSPSIDIKITYPDTKTSRIQAKFQRVATKEFSGEIKIESLKDFSLDMHGDAKLESVDDFHITVNIHSEKLKLNKVKLEALNKPSKSGKRIQFSAKSADQNLLSGSTNYKVIEDGGKYIVEGAGSFKIKDETKTANFKYIRQNLVQEKDGEQGIEIVLNAGLGAQGIVGELKLTNKQFRIMNSYCEEKKQCAHVEVFSKASTDDATHFNHELEVNVDLRKLGLSHEFGLKAVTNRKDFVLDHTVDVHFESSANSKYQYSLYVHPKEAGIVFTMPKRVVALEGKFDIPAATKGKIGPIKGEICFCMNKNVEPNKKTVLSFVIGQEYTDKHGRSNLEVKFNNPNLNKELMIKYEAKFDVPSKVAEFNIELDVFGKKSHKISITGVTKATALDNGYKILGEIDMASKGLNLELKATEFIAMQPYDVSYGYKLHYHIDKSKSESEVSAKANMKEVVVLLKLLNKDLLNVNSQLQLSKENLVADTTIAAYGVKPVITHTEVKNYNTLIFTLARKDTPKNKLHVTSGLVFGQIADFRAEIIKGTSKNDLVHASVKLDDANFMKPDFGINVEHIQKLLLEPIRVELTHGLEEIKKLVQEYQQTLSAQMTQISEMVRKNVPNLKPMITYYQTELGKLKDELVSDKTIQEVSEFMKKIFGAAVHTFSDLFTKMSEIAEKLTQILQEHFTKMTDVIAKNVLPAIKEIGSKVLDFYVGIMKNVYDITMLYVVKLSELLKVHQGELKQIATVLSEAFQDIGQMIFKSLKNVRDEVQHLLMELFEQVKALPIFDELQQRLNEIRSGMPVPDHVINIINEVFNTVKDAMPTREVTEAITVLQEYVVKKLKQEKVDDMDSLRKIYSHFVRAVNSIVDLLRKSQASSEDVKGIFENMLPLPMDTMIRLPRLIAVKLSPLRLLTSGELPSPRDFLHAVTFNPVDWVPPFEHHAIIAQGQHIFTFDERHLTFPGVCSYVLAKDVINGNFTLVGTYKDGLMEALTFSDKHDVVTIKKNHEIVLNGAGCELPIRHKALQVFRLYETINIVSKAGIRIVCEPHLLGCGVHVSGFYHGQMRGLLGNGNNEPFDDFLLPNEKISLKEDEFGNAYQVGAGCAPVKTVDHHEHHHNPTCDALFSMESSLRLCFPFVDTTSFKQACEHGMASKIPDTEKAISMAYVAACRHRNIPVNTPAKFVQCRNSETPVDMGSQFSVKVPGKSADVVIIVEQNKDNEVIFKELVQPMVTSLTNDLASKGITDINFSLIGYGGEYQKWPSHYTSGGKLAFHGKSATLKFVDPPKPEPIQTGNKRFDELLEKVLEAKNLVQMHLSMTPVGFAVREGMSYPFRAHAVKNVIVVPGHSQNIAVPVLSLLKFYVLYGQNNGMKFNMITPIELRMKDAKLQKNLIGFNDHAAFTFSGKKVGNQDLRKDVEYGEDPAVQWAMRVGGNVFVSSNFVASKAGQRKTFVQVVSHQIAEQMTNVEQTLDCECVMVNPYDARNVCRVTSSREKESTARKGGVKG